MSLREREWRFSRTVGDVQDSVEAKIAHHQERIGFWEAEQERVMDEIRATGITVTAHEITGGQRADIKIDATLSNRLGECENKLSAHRRKLAEYDLWQEICNSEDDARALELDWDDLQFFFGAPTAERSGRAL